MNDYAGYFRAELGVGLPALRLRIIEGRRLIAAKEMYQWEDQESRYERLFNGIPLGLYRTTADGRLLDANKAQVDMLGFPDVDAYRRVDINDLWVNPSCRRDLLAQLHQDRFVQDFETELRRRDGEIITVRISVRAITDEHGQVILMEGVCEDITALRHAEEERRNLERQLLEAQKTEEQLIRVLRLLCEGNSDYTIARKTGLSLRTTQRRIQRLREVLSVDSRTALAARGSALGLIQQSTDSANP